MAKKKSKKKKKRPSQAWKGLEKHVAEVLGGTRILRGSNFSMSLPDVVVDGQALGLPAGTSIVVECKHSKNQPFIELFKNSFTKDLVIAIADYDSDGVTALDALIFWDLNDTKEVLDSFRAGIDPADITEQLKAIPQYIRDNLIQAEGYNLVNCPAGNKIFRMVVMAKKNQPLRLAYSKLSYLLALEE